METRVTYISSALVSETEKIIVGKKGQIQLMIAALLAQGHVLLEDMPGVGKTTLIKTLSKALGFEFKRIQFTPDLLPSDVTGMNIFDRNTNEFKFVKGPVHTNILLADEINRAIPRTQSALLESMEERQVTIDGRSVPLPKPFFVLATQNPVESESTFQLPAAQMDRFMIRLTLGYPDMEEEIAILNNHKSSIMLNEIKAVTNPEEFIGVQEDVEKIEISGILLEYIVKIVQATRTHTKIKYGASPRAALALMKISKAYAGIMGRNYVIPDDIKACACPVLCHRIILNSNARLSGDDAYTCIVEIISKQLVPPEKEQIITKE